MNRRVKLLVGSAAGLTLVLLALPKRRPETPVTAPIAASPKTVEPVAIVKPIIPATPEQLAAQSERSATLRWGRDPFAPPAKPEPPEQLEVVLPPEAVPQVEAPIPVVEPSVPIIPVAKPRLTGVGMRGTQSWCILDGQVVTEGDLVSTGHRVGQISKRSVILWLDEQELTLNLGDDN